MLTRCSVSLFLLSLWTAACGGSTDGKQPSARSSSLAELDSSGLKAFEKKTCRGITVVWLGKPIVVGGVVSLWGGFKRLDIRLANDKAMTWFENNTDYAHFVPEVIFAPDCEHVAVLNGSLSATYLILATKDLVAYSQGQAVMAKHIDLQAPCEVGAVGYFGLKWRTNTQFEFHVTEDDDPTIPRTADISSIPWTPAKPLPPPCQR